MMDLLALRKHWRTAALAATGGAGEGPLFLLGYLLRFLRVVLLLSLWRTILGAQGAAGMSLDAVLTYTLCAAVFGGPLASRTGLEQDLWSGAVVTRLLQPVGLVGHVVAQMVGGWLFEAALFSLPLFVVAPLLGVNPWPAGVAAGALFAVSLVLGVAVGVAMDFILAALMVALGWSVWEVERLRAVVGALLSGSLLPLSLLPWGLGDVLVWLPFAALAWAPLSIYTGTGEPLPLLARQLAWTVVLWPLARWLWRVHRQKVVVYGG